MLNLKYRTFRDHLLDTQNNLAVDPARLSHALRLQLDRFTQENKSYRSLDTKTARAQAVFKDIENLTNEPLKPGAFFREDQAILSVDQGFGLLTEKGVIHLPFKVAAWFFLHRQRVAIFAQNIDLDVLGLTYKEARRQARTYHKLREIHRPGFNKRKTRAKKTAPAHIADVAPPELSELPPDQVLEQLQEKRQALVQLETTVRDLLSAKFPADDSKLSELARTEFLLSKNKYLTFIQERFEAFFTPAPPQVLGSDLRTSLKAAEWALKVQELDTAAGSLRAADAALAQKTQENALLNSPALCIQANINVLLGHLALFWEDATVAVERFRRAIELTSLQDEKAAAELRGECYRELFNRGQKTTETGIRGAIELALEDFSYWQAKDDGRAAATLNNLGHFRMQLAHQRQPDEALKLLDDAEDNLTRAAGVLDRAEHPKYFGKNVMLRVNLDMARIAKDKSHSTIERIQRLILECDTAIEVFCDLEDVYAGSTAMIQKASLLQELAGLIGGSAGAKTSDRAEKVLRDAIDFLDADAYRHRHGEALENLGQLYAHRLRSLPAENEHRDLLNAKARNAFQRALVSFQASEAPFNYQKCLMQMSVLNQRDA